MRTILTVCAVVFLFCVGARSQSAGTLRAGFAKMDVTPSEPVMMVGYDMRGAPSEGVHGDDKLYVRALVFDDGRSKVMFVEGDVIMIREHDTWKKRISDATGIPAEHILIGDAHNHAAPSPSPAGETNWERQFGQALMAAVKQAAGNLVPVKIAAGNGTSRVAMNRRHLRPEASESILTFDENARSQSFGKFKVDQPKKIFEPAGVMRLGANPSGPIDDAVQLVRIDTAAGKPLAVMIHYACHGTSLGGRNGKVSAEWMGSMQKYVEQQIPGAGSFYVQGAAGDINPRVVGGLDGYVDNIETTRALGLEIGREVVRVYRKLMPEPSDSAIEVKSRDIRLPVAYRLLFEDFNETTVHVPTTAVRIGDLMWVTFPGELFHAIGKRVKAACPAAHGHLMGYTNGYVGYLPEQKAFAEGGYEPAVSHFDPTAEHVYLKEVAELLAQFR